MTNNIRMVSACLMLCVGYASDDDGDGLDTLLPPVATSAAISVAGIGGGAVAPTVFDLKERLKKADKDLEFVQAAQALLGHKGPFPTSLMLKCLNHEEGKNSRLLWENFLSVLQLSYANQPDVLEELFESFTKALIFLKRESLGGTRRKLKSTTVQELLSVNPMVCRGASFPHSFLDYYRAISSIAQRFQSYEELQCEASYADFFEKLYLNSRGGDLFNPILQASLNLTPAYLRGALGVTHDGHFGLYFGEREQGKLAAITGSQPFKAILAKLTSVGTYDISHMSDSPSSFHVTINGFVNRRMISDLIGRAIGIEQAKNELRARNTKNGYWDNTLDGIEHNKAEHTDAFSELVNAIEPVCLKWKKSLPRLVAGLIQGVRIFEPNPTTRWLVLILRTNIPNEESVVGLHPHVSLLKITKPRPFGPGELDCLRLDLDALKKCAIPKRVDCLPFSSLVLSTDFNQQHFTCFESQLSA